MLKNDSKTSNSDKQKDLQAPNPKSPDSLEQFINNHSNTLAGKIWRGAKARQSSKAQNRQVDTGFAELNTALHGGGWPTRSMTELGLNYDGIGELRLLLPALKQLQEKSLQKNIILVNPPYLPFAPAWVKEGIQIEQLTIIKTNNIKDTLWSIEHCLNAECCAAVLGWTGRYNINTQELRRLQLATEKSHTWNVLLRHERCLDQASVSGLRLKISANPYSQLDINILKQPNGWGGQQCTLSLHPHYENWQRIPVELLPYSHNQQERLKGKAHKIKSAKVTLLYSVSALKVVH